MDLTKILKLCSSKDTVNKIKRQVTAWEKTFPRYISDTRHILKI